MVRQTRAGDPEFVGEVGGISGSCTQGEQQSAADRVGEGTAEPRQHLEVGREIQHKLNDTQEPESTEVWIVDSGYGTPAGRSRSVVVRRISMDRAVRAFAVRCRPCAAAVGGELEDALRLVVDLEGGVRDAVVAANEVLKAAAHRP